MSVDWVAIAFIGPSSPFGHAPLEILEVEVQLLKRETECKEALSRVAGKKTSRETVATEGGNFGSTVGTIDFNRLSTIAKLR